MDVDYEVVASINDAIRITGFSLPSNIDSFPSDVKAYIYLRFISAAINKLRGDYGTGVFTAEKQYCYPLLDADMNVGASFPYWNGGLTRFWCGARIAVLSVGAARYCRSQFREYWEQLTIPNNTPMSEPSNIGELLPDIQAYIRLRIAAHGLNGSTGGGMYFPAFWIDISSNTDMNSIMNYHPEQFETMIRNISCKFFEVVTEEKSLINIGLNSEAKAAAAASANELLWKKLIGIVV